MRFASRLPDDLEPSGFFRAVEERRARPEPLLDLTVSNPTRAGIEYPQAEIQAALAAGAGHPYEPDPKGMPLAREAVAEYYRDRGCRISPDSIVLTSGTSEAYAFLFKLLCDPGDSILFPKPSYPLVELLAELESVAARPYRLAGADYRFEADALRESLAPDTRAAVLVSPNNPTGSMLTETELRAVGAVCAGRGIGLIVDEVFLDYPAPGRAGSVVTSAANPDALTFTLGGLSKACGLPQMKLSWIAVGGPPEEARRAIARLEFIADAFLTVGTPVQQAAPALLALGGRVRDQIRRRVDGNDRALREILAGAPGVSILPRDGGWYAVIGLPPGTEDEEFALGFLNAESVLVQPGYLFDFDDAQTAVVSLLTPEDSLREGLARFRRHLSAHRE